MSKLYVTSYLSIDIRHVFWRLDLIIEQCIGRDSKAISIDMIYP